MKNVRDLFPVVQEFTYLNSAGVAPPPITVRQNANAWLKDIETHGLVEDDRWERMADAVRADAAALIGADIDEIAFVRNTSHGLGLVAEGIAWKAGDEVAVATTLEYPSNVYPWLHLADRGVKVNDIAVVDGGVTLQAVSDALTPRTRMVAVSAVQYATGHKTDLVALGALCKERGLLFCVDGIQQVGSVPIDVKAANIHFLSADSHKWMLGQPGIGIFYVDQSVVDQLRPVLVGWKSSVHAFDFDRAQFVLPQNARKFEEGSPAYVMIAAMGAGLRMLLECGIDEIAAHNKGLLDRLEGAALDIGIAVGPHARDRAGIITLAPRGDVQAHYDLCKERKIAISIRRGRLRVAPHLFNNEADIDALIDVLRHFCLMG